MFKSLARQATIRVASPSHAGLRTSAIHLAQHRGKGAKGSKSAVRQERKRAKDAARVYCVLGIPRGGKDTWPQCDLAKVLITEDKLKSEDAHEFIEFAEGTVKVPSDLNFSISGKGTKMLFEHLPTLAAEQGTTVFDADTVRQTAEAMNREVEKANVFGKLVSLRNANAQGVAYENRRRCIKLFSSPTNPNDTGRPEVQAAILTLKIRNLWSHLLKYRMDVNNRRGLRSMVHQRAKTLRYLKRIDRDRYEAVLLRLGLDQGSVEGELVI